MNFWIRLNMFLRSFFLQAGWNFVKYQNLGFTFVMIPFLRHLYKEDREVLPTVLQRYLSVFNTNPIMASFCFGAMAKQEEVIKNAPTLTTYKEQVAQWTGMRRGLSITAASIGDRLFWGTLKPLTLLLSLFIWMILGLPFYATYFSDSTPRAYVFAGGLAGLVVYNSIAWFVRWQGIKMGYNADESACCGLTSFDWNCTIYYAKRLGLICVCVLILFGVYHCFSGIQGLDVSFMARAALVVCCVIAAFITRRLRIPNVYLYLAAAVTFSIVCLF